MRKQMIENAAYEVATQVRAVEDSIEAALAEIAELQARIMRVNAVARRRLRQQSIRCFEQLAAAVPAWSRRAASIVGCQRALAEAKSKVPGLRTVAFGDGDECPTEDGLADLRIVA